VFRNVAQLPQEICSGRAARAERGVLNRDARRVFGRANRHPSERTIIDELEKDRSRLVYAITFPAAVEYPDLYRRPVSGQRLISQEILLLPLIYRAKLPDTEACLGKSPYNWLLEGLRATPFRHLSLPTLPGAIPRATPPRVIHVGSCYSELGRKIHDEESRRRILLPELSLPRNSHPPCPSQRRIIYRPHIDPRHGVICFVARSYREIITQTEDNYNRYRAVVLFYIPARQRGTFRVTTNRDYRFIDMSLGRSSSLPFQSRPYLFPYRFPRVT
jgi:hypothetical protein